MRKKAREKFIAIPFDRSKSMPADFIKFTCRPLFPILITLDEDFKGPIVIINKAYFQQADEK